MRTNKMLRVYLKDELVGTLALTADRKAAFEYSDEWLENGFSISPFSLPLEKKVFVPSKPYFNGLFGVFADSLPDAWGNILLNRLLKKRGINVSEFTVLDRLAIVGNSGMGALSYRPEIMLDSEDSEFDLDDLAEQCKQVLTTEYNENLDQLYQLGGTSGGARPKILTKFDEESWIIKFPAHIDMQESGQMEYDYAQCAKQCGIVMTQTKLFSSKKCKGYFGVQRFDRKPASDSQAEEKVHMCTVAALLETDFNQPSLDYNDLMKLTKILTRDHPGDVENMFRRMCFNVFAHNRDDHAKNFTYLYDQDNDRWRLSPAYDITYSNIYYGEHTTSVDGNGNNPGEKELLRVGLNAGLGEKKCREIMTEIRSIVQQRLQRYFI